jgi:DNA mismatch repair protein MutS2
MRRELDEQRTRIDQERREVLRAARADFEAQMAEVRQRLRRLSTDLSTVTATRDWLQSAEREVKAIEETLPLPPARETPAAGPLTEGQRVWVRTLEQWGTVESLPAGAGDAEVLVGSFKVRVPVSELEARPEAPVPPARSAQPSTPRGAHVPLAVHRAPSIQIDLRGQRAEEVAYLLDRYLDDAFLAGLSQVRIVHGKGTGALRKVVREYLTGHPNVQSFRLGEMNEGGDGVTVVQLAQQ